MEAVLVYILKSIVQYPNDVAVEASEVDSSVTFTVSANPDDIGKIIGKSGQTIKAIRNIVKIIATKEGKWVNIELAEADS